jgi:hypothetical protein
MHLPEVHTDDHGHREDQHADPHLGPARRRAVTKREGSTRSLDVDGDHLRNVCGHAVAIPEGLHCTGSGEAAEGVRNPRDPPCPRGPDSAPQIKTRARPRLTMGRKVIHAPPDIFI